MKHQVEECDAFNTGHVVTGAGYIFGTISTKSSQILCTNFYNKLLFSFDMSRQGGKLKPLKVCDVLSNKYQLILLLWFLGS